MLLKNRRFTHMHLDGNNFGHSDKTCQALDQWLKHARELEELSLCRNNLQWLPTGGADSLALQSLKILRASKNYLKHFPESQPLEIQHDVNTNAVDRTVAEDVNNNFALLSVIDLSENEIVEILPSISLCKSVRELNLSSNQLSVLPNEIATLGHLESLNLSHNRLKNLPNSFR